MKELFIDIETYSSVDLTKCGVYKYAESPDFEILLFGYSVDGSDVHVVDLANGECIPDEIISALTDETVIKYAHNASFERVCLSRYLGYETGTYIDPASWRCTLVWASYLGLPKSLAEIGEVLNLEEQKLAEGKELIKMFCMLQKSQQKKAMTEPLYCLQSSQAESEIDQPHLQRVYPKDAPDAWSLFKKYNKRDVEVEMHLAQKLSRFPMPDFLWREYELDQQINDRGICVDMELVRQAIAMDEISRTELEGEMKRLTGLDNPNSTLQLHDWLLSQGIETSELRQKTVQSIMRNTSSELVRQVLAIRLQLAKSSVRKYTAMQNAVCSDGRVRGMFQFYGANRTGRFSSRIVQLQNLRQNHLPDLAQARELVKTGNYEAVEILYGDVPDTLSQLVRTAFIPRDGAKFYVADFSAIEARVIAWLAGERWVLDAFASGKDIYCETASRMFGVPVEKHGVNAELRQKGKIAQLANGYGGSVGALKAMGALDMGLSEDELQPLVDSWRDANPNIVKFWWAVDRCIKQTIRERTITKAHGIIFSYESGMLFIQIPSGRRLCYVKPQIGENSFGGESVTYMGVGATKKWERIESYGPKFVENIVQATARDLLCFAMTGQSHCSIVAHVHDEMIIEAYPDMSLDALCSQMARVPEWAEGLLLRADGYTCDFYMKD